MGSGPVGMAVVGHIFPRPVGRQCGRDCNLNVNAVNLKIFIKDAHRLGVGTICIRPCPIWAKETETGG